MSEYEDRHRQPLLAGGWVPREPTSAQLPDSAAENRAYAGFGGVIAIGLLTVLGLYAYLDNPHAAGLAQGEIGRLVAVRQFYAAPRADGQARRSILGLGDSLTVSGLDCRVLDELAGPGYVSYNLGVPAKCHMEFLLDLEQPVVRRSLIVTLASPAGTFSSWAAALEPRRANALRLLGYPAQSAELEAYRGWVPASGLAYYAEPYYVHVLDSRWRIPVNLKALLQPAWPGTPRSTKQELRYLRDVYARDLKGIDLPGLPAEQRRTALARRLRAEPGLYAGGYHPDPGALSAYPRVIGQLAQATQGVVIILAPLSPDYRRALGDRGFRQYRQAVLACAADNVRVLDYSDLLGPADFWDDVHANAQGARKITRALAADLGFGAPAAGQPGPAAGLGVLK